MVSTVAPAPGKRSSQCGWEPAIFQGDGAAVTAIRHLKKALADVVLAVSGAQDGPAVPRKVSVPAAANRTDQQARWRPDARPARIGPIQASGFFAALGGTPRSSSVIQRGRAQLIGNLSRGPPRGASTEPSPR